MRSRMAAAAFVLAFWMAPAYGDEQADAVQLDPVVVTAYPDPEFMSYIDAYKAIVKFDALKERQMIQQKFWLAPKHRDVSLESLKVMLQTSEGTLPIRVNGDRSVEVPLLAPHLVETAEFMVTVPRGTLSTFMTVEIKPPSALAVTYDGLRAALKQVDKAERALGPLWIRLLPKHTAVAITFDHDGEVQLVKDTELLSMLKSRDRLVLLDLSEDKYSGAIIKFSSAPMRIEAR